MTDQRLCYQGRVVDVYRERVRLPNDARVELDIVRHPGGAAAVALDDQGRVCLLRQYRHAAAGWLWELPAGKLDPGESPRTTVERELVEEAGMAAADWVSLGRLHSSPGVLTEVIHLYLARDLSPRALAHEHGELIEVHWIPLEMALGRCHSGDITDAKTLVGLFRAAALLQAPRARGVAADEGMATGETA
ncbi:NUDIX hydrolase [Thiorhodovibrio winogradskyi]|nr:NUDIX hydrolase [Thiorhodovibrio winogradskyi]